MYWMHGGLNGDSYYPDSDYNDAFPSGEFHGGASGDPLFYHSKVEYKKIQHQTEKATLFLFHNGLDLWVAKKLCVGLDLERKTVFIHKLGEKIRARVLELKEEK